MSAIVRKKYEDPVLTSESIEVHLTYLRSGLDGVQAALPVLRDKIDDLNTALSGKIDQLNSKIDNVNSTLSEKIDRLNSKIENGDSALNGKIDNVNSTLSEKIDNFNSTLSEKIDNTNARISTVSDGLADVRGVLKAMFWVLGSAGALTALAALAQTARFFKLI
jgi:uncharacterized phage infection (PIP) family protein YhgE